MYIELNSLPVDAPLRITSRFGYRKTGIKGASTYHKGVDIGRDFARKETYILAAAAGAVTNNYWDDVRGWVIIINHGEFKTLYQHLKEKSKLKIGINVEAGTQIGVMGASTKTIKNMTVHLHFELIVNEISIDPESYLKKVRNHNGKKEKSAMERYKKVEEMPESLQKDIQALIDCDALAGRSEGNLDITEDMARMLVISKRYMDKQLNELKKWNQQL